MTSSSALSQAFLVGGARTPVGRYGGALSGVRPDDLAALCIRRVIEASGLDPAVVDEVILGNANGAGEENRNVARMAWLLNGYPDTVPGITVNRLCASGMSAITLAQQMIASGAAEIVVAGGVESMSRAPWVQAKPPTAFAKLGESLDTSIGWRFVNPAFAAESHVKALAAIRAGKFDSEIMPVTVRDRKGRETVVDTDEGPREGSTPEVLAQLRPVVAAGSVVTAGNSSSLNDGASAVIVASESAVQKYGLHARARVVLGTSAGLAPEIMGLGPVPASEKALKRAGWSVDDLGSVEINEAFASQSLGSIRRLGLDPGIVNRWGGAIALGHPLGSSGSRIAITLMNRMEDEDTQRGLATMCIGVGQGAALLLERV